MKGWPTWTYDKHDKRKDPINIIFYFNETKASQALIDRAWKSPPVYLGLIPSVHSQYIRQDDNRIVQKTQLIKGPLHDRYHIRIWEWDNDSTVSGAHHEYGLTLGIVPVQIRGRGHYPEFEKGKWKIENDLRPNHEVEHDGIDLGNIREEPFSNGKATAIRKVAG